MARLLKNWLTSYLDYVKESEAPTDYNFWSGISAISATLRRNVWLTRGLYKIYPNQYIILVGPPGIGKGEAITPATELVKQAKTAEYLSDRVTAEKIVDRLATGFTITRSVGGNVQITQDHSATILSTELPIFIGASDWMLPFLCELWNKGEFEYDTKHKGSFTVKNLCVGLLAGCVPDYIRKINRDANSAITGGFTSRCIFVYAGEKSQRNPWPLDNGNAQLVNELLDDLKDMSQAAGEFKFHTDARPTWESFYKSIKSTEFESDVVAGFKERMPAHVVKTAMALSVSETNNLIITDAHLQQSIKLVNKSLERLDITFRAVGESPIAAAQDKVMRFIEQNGLVSRAQIMRALHRHIGTDENLEMVLRVLVLMGFCAERSIGNKLYYEHNPNMPVVGKTGVNNP